MKSLKEEMLELFTTDKYFDEEDNKEVEKIIKKSQVPKKRNIFDYYDEVSFIPGSTIPDTEEGRNLFKILDDSMDKFIKEKSKNE